MRISMSHGFRISDYVILIFMIVFLACRIGFSFFSDNSDTDKIKFFESVIDELLKSGADTNFVYSIIKHPKTEFNEKFVRINVIGYMNKTDYSQNYTEYSVERCINFINEYSEVLNKCELTYKIPKEIITSILWIESKFGKFYGKYHIPSVYLSTAMAAGSEYIQMNKDYLAQNYFADENEMVELFKKIEERSYKKSKWAINELVALGQMSKHNLPIHDYKCSWAGAFGILQFLPSSFIRFAVDGNSDGKINLYDYSDAIASTANYLMNSGWADDEQSKYNALYKYNNSSDYVNAVLTLSSKIDNTLINHSNNKIGKY